MIEPVLAAARSALRNRPLDDVVVLAHVSGERLVLRCRAGGTRVLVRCVERDLAHRQYRYLEALSSARGGVLRVPAPIAIAPVAAAESGTPGDGRTPAWAVLVLEYVEGTACPQLVEHHLASRTDHRAREAMTLAGRALAELHAIDPVRTPALEVAGTEAHLADLVRPAPATLADAMPAWSGVIERALRHVRSASAGGATNAVVHRDVHLRQMFVQNGRMGLVDWDLAALGDPAFDVAYLTTHLETHLERSEELIRAVIEGYDDPAMTPERLAPWRSFNLLRRACRRFRLRDAGWEAELERMLSMLADGLDEAEVAEVAEVAA